MQQQSQQQDDEDQNQNQEIDNNIESDLNSYLSGDLEINSDDSENFRQILVIQKEMRQQKQAKKANKLPDEIANLMGEANQYFINSKFDQAIEKLYEIIRKYPNFPEPFNLLGLISEERGEYKKSAHFFRLAAEMSHSKELWQKIGYLYKQTGWYEQASTCFGRALKSDPLNSQLIQERAQCCEQIHDYKKSAIYYEKLSKMFIKDKELIKKTARIYAKSGQHQLAIQKLKEFIINNDDKFDENIVHMVVELYIYVENYKECSEFMEKYMRREEFLKYGLELLEQYLICQMKKKVKEEQIRDLVEIVLERKVEDEYEVEVMMQIGRLLSENGHVHSSRDVYEHLMTINITHQHHYQLYLHLAQVYYTLQDHQSAIDSYLEAIQLDPNQIQARILLSELYQKLGKLQNAFDILQYSSNHIQYHHNLFFSELDQDLPSNNQQYYSYYNESLPLKSFSQSQLSQLPLQSQLPQLSQQQQQSQLLQQSQQQQQQQQKQQKIQQQRQKYKHQVQYNFQQSSNQEEYEQEIENEIQNLNQQIQLQQYKVVLQKGELLLQQNKAYEYIMNSLDTIMEILNQEYIIQILKEKILHIYYKESYKKSFNKVQTYQDLNQQANKQCYLIQTKKQNCNKNLLFQKKKIKQSEKLTQIQIKKIDFFTKIEGMDRLMEIVHQMNHHLVQLNFNNKNLQLMLFVTRLDYISGDDKLFFLLQGLRSSIQASKFDIAFHFIKKIIKIYQNNIIQKQIPQQDSSNNNQFIDCYNQKIINQKKKYYFMIIMLAQIIKNLKEIKITRSYILKMAKKIHQINKLNKNEEDQVNNEFQWSFIQANSYLQSGYFELSIKIYYALYQKNPENSLVLLQLANSYIQESLRRTQQEKELALRRSFYFLYKYSQMRIKSDSNYQQQYYKIEILYNQGKSLAQVGFLQQSIQSFNSVLEIYDHLNKQPQILQQIGYQIYNKTLYNLIIIYKELNEHHLALDLLSKYK